MNQTLVLELARNSLTVSLLVGAPFLAASLVIGVLVSIFQAVTQIQEMTLTFVPKTLGIVLVALLFGPWMLDTLTTYTAGLLSSMATLAR